MTGADLKRLATEGRALRAEVLELVPPLEKASTELQAMLRRPPPGMTFTELEHLRTVSRDLDSALSGTWRWNTTIDEAIAAAEGPRTPYTTGGKLKRVTAALAEGRSLLRALPTHPPRIDALRAELAAPRPPAATPRPAPPARSLESAPSAAPSAAPPAAPTGVAAAPPPGPDPRPAAPRTVPAPADDEFGGLNRTP